MTNYVELSIKEGPVEIDTLFGAGAEKEVPLWDEIVGRETFSATKESAFYQQSTFPVARFGVWEFETAHCYDKIIPDLNKGMTGNTFRGNIKGPGSVCL